MSWISENYEKAAVGVSVLTAAGLVSLGWSKLGSVELDFGNSAKGEPPVSDPGVKNAGIVAKTKSSFQLKREWNRGEDDLRAVDLFTGVALFVNKNELKKTVDLIKDSDVHQGIPNSWWLEHRIDPGFDDSPLRDEDGDGFTNAEEYAANTDPSDNEEYPSLITKLTYIGAESEQWILRPGFEAGGGSFTFTWGNGKETNRVGATAPVPPGGIFFQEGAAAGRFKLLGSEVRKVWNEAMKADENVTFVKIEDQKANKKGRIYEIPAAFRKANQTKFAQFDHTAVLTLEAIGLEGQEIRIEENAAFSLPPGGEKKAFKLKEVTPERIVIEFTSEEGKVLTQEIIKRAISSNAPAVP